MIALYVIRNCWLFQNPGRHFFLGFLRTGVWPTRIPVRFSGNLAFFTFVLYPNHSSLLTIPILSYFSSAKNTYPSNHFIVQQMFFKIYCDMENFLWTRFAGRHFPREPANFVHRKFSMSQEILKNICWTIKWLEGYCVFSTWIVSQYGYC